MESTLLAESLRQQRPDVKIFEALKISLRNEIVSWVSMKLLTSVNLDDDTVLAFSTVRREQNGSSAVIMSCLSTVNLTSNVPPLFLGLLSAEVNCGVFATVRGLQLYATGDSDGSITLFSCTKQKVTLAELNNCDNRSRPVLQIIHSPYKKETSRVCFWVAYPGIIEQITCKIIDDSVSQFVRTISLSYDEVEFGRFNYFEMMDSRFGENSLLAVHFLKKSHAVVLPLNALYAQDLCEKACLDGYCVEHNLSSMTSLSISGPRGEEVIHSTIIPSSIRTWTATAPLPLADGVTFDMKALLCSYSFQAVCLLKNKEFQTAHFITAEQRVVDTIVEIGPAAFQCPDTDVSYSPSRGLENGEQSVVVIYHTSETGDEIIMLTVQKSTLSKEKKAQFSTLWRACVELKMFSPCRAGSIIHQGNALLQEIKEGGQNQDPESDRQQRMIVLESTLTAGLGSVLYDYVIAQAATSNAFSQEYILFDVGAIFVWTVGVHQQTATQAHLLTAEMIAPYLVHRESLSEEESTDSNHFGQAFVSSTRSQLVSHISTLHGTSLIFSALSARKKSSFLLHREGAKWTNDREARDEHEDALETLDDFSSEAKVLIGVLKVILTTFDSNVKLSSFMNHPQQEFSLSGLRRTRLDSSEEMLPAVLCSDNLLLDVLNDRLHSKVQPYAGIPQENPYLIKGETLDPAFYKAVADFMWLPLMSALIKAEQDPKGIVVPVGRSVRALSCTAAQSVVLYSLLDALLLTNSYYEQPALRTVHSDEYDSFSRVIGAAYDMDPRARTLLLALWRIDSRIEIQKAVADLCSPAVALFEDATLFFKVACRLLSYDAKSEAKELLSHAKSRSQLMRTEKGILVLLAASVDAHVWQFAWHIARKSCEELEQYTESDGTIVQKNAVVSSAKKAVCEMLCRWALLEGELGSFLDTAMDSEEQEVIYRVLKEYADIEISRSLYPAPCVDVLILWLAMNRKAGDALKVHEIHTQSLRATILTEAVLRSIHLRKSLIENYLKFPPIAHSVRRDVKGRFMEPPLLKPTHSIPAPNPYLQPTSTQEPMATEAQEDYVIVQDMETETDAEVEAEIEAGVTSSMDESPYQSSPEEEMTHTPYISTPFTDGNQSFNTAMTNAKTPWSSESDFNYTDTRISEDDNFNKRTPLATPHSASENVREGLFTSPIRPSFQLDPPFSLPFNSASKKAGFLSDTDTKSSASAIRKVFEDMTSSFSPVEASARKERLPTRRKVRFSEG